MYVPGQLVLPSILGGDTGMAKKVTRLLLLQVRAL